MLKCSRKNLPIPIFQQPILFENQLGDLANPYDATKTGPLCAQGTTDSNAVDELLNMEVIDIISDLLSSIDIGIPLPEELVIGIIENMLKVNLMEKTGYDLLDELIDVQNVEFVEDCLHLAVSTPQIPQVDFTSILYGANIKTNFAITQSKCSKNIIGKLVFTKLD